MVQLLVHMIFTLRTSAITIEVRMLISRKTTTMKARTNILMVRRAIEHSQGRQVVIASELLSTRFSGSSIDHNTLFHKK